MDCSVVTPSWRSLKWLPLCVASVGDQSGVRFEHIIQDSLSDDGTLDWLLKAPRVRAFAEKDCGMYDGINRGLQKSSGRILCYLNADEQLLPGTLSRVCDFFAQNSDVDLVFGDVVAVNPSGEYLFHRKVDVPLLYRTWVDSLSTLSCGMFFRREVVDHHGAFDPSWRYVGDAEWILRLLKKRVRMSTLNCFTSVFTVTGENLSLHSGVIAEQRRLRGGAPSWARAMRPLLVLHHRTRRLFGGMYSQQPFSYNIYTRGSMGTRIIHHVERPDFRWKW